MAETPDPLAGELATIKERASQITDEHGPGDCDLNGGPCTGHDAERLAAAVEAVLAQAQDWHDRGHALIAQVVAEDAGPVRAA